MAAPAPAANLAVLMTLILPICLGTIFALITMTTLFISLYFYKMSICPIAISMNGRYNTYMKNTTKDAGMKITLTLLSREQLEKVAYELYLQAERLRAELDKKNKIVR